MGVAQDQDFLNAPSDQQHAYLMSVDKDYAKAPPDQQKEFLRSVNNPDPETMLAKSQADAKTQGTAPLTAAATESGKGADLLANIAGHPYAPKNEQEADQQMKQTTRRMGEGYSGPLTAAIPGPGEGGSLLAQAAKGAGAGAGVGALEHGLSDAWRGELPDVGGTLKAAATGGLMGAVGGPLMNYPPVRNALESVPFLRKYLPQEEDEVKQAVRNREANWIPTKIKAVPPQEAPARMGGFNPGSPDVNVIPEPRGEFEGEVPNYMASVPREELNRLALAAKPGAGKQLQQLGKPVIYTPRGSY